MSEILSKYRKGYVTSVTPSGRKSKSNGDAVAEALEGFEAMSVIIAAEQLGRKCYAMEIEPRYVDVAVKRWENFIGKQAKLGVA